MTLLFLTYGALCVADTSMNKKIPENSVRKIECSAKNESLSGNRGVSAKAGKYHYQVYLPKGYYQDKKRYYPSLFIASPGGNADMGNVEKIMAERKWIVIMLVESQNNSPQGVAEGNFIAAHDDAVKRFRLQEGMKFTTGLSGGARRQSLNAGLRPGFAGIILQGAGFIQDGITHGYYMETVKQNPNIGVYGIFGTGDPNRVEIGIIDGMLPEDTPRCFARFKGGHEWAPPERMEEAIDWVFFNALMKLDLSGNGAAFLNNVIDDALGLASQTGISRTKGTLALSDLAVILEKRDLRNNEAFKERNFKVEAALKKFTAEKNIADELAAKNEYEIIAMKESSALGRQRPFRATQFMVPATKEAAAMTAVYDGRPAPATILEKLPGEYETCSKNYPDTFYGRWAAVKSKVVSVLLPKNKCRGTCKVMKVQSQNKTLEPPASEK